MSPYISFSNVLEVESAFQVNCALKFCAENFQSVVSCRYLTQNKYQVFGCSQLVETGVYSDHVL